jgi:hypothetical protein
VTHYLISFPSAAMVLTDDELPDVDRATRAVIAEAKAAGVYVFGGGINEGVAPVLVHADGTLSAETTTHLDGGFCVLRLQSRQEAQAWAAKLATSCRTPQELREFHYDPDS